MVNRHCPPYFSFITGIPTTPMYPVSCRPHSSSKYFAVEILQVKTYILPRRVTWSLWNYQNLRTFFKPREYYHKINRSLHYSQTEYAHEIRRKCIQSKHHKRNTTCWLRGSGGRSGVMKSKGLYTCVTVPIYERCSALNHINISISNITTCKFYGLYIFIYWIIFITIKICNS